VRIVYRVSQFWNTLSKKADPGLVDEAHRQLTPPQRELFTQLQPSEQKHAISIWRKLIDQGEEQPDLLVAALLHDVGKLRYPMALWQRVLVVLVKASMPSRFRLWGSMPLGNWQKLPSWRKAFIVAEQHPHWGAELAHQAGVSPLAEYLVREHHHPWGQDVDTPESNLLHRLWLIDNES
jgi:hypothetical protein